MGASGSPQRWRNRPRHWRIAFRLFLPISRRWIWHRGSRRWRREISIAVILFPAGRRRLRRHLSWRGSTICKRGTVRNTRSFRGGGGITGRRWVRWRLRGCRRSAIPLRPCCRTFRISPLVTLIAVLWPGVRACAISCAPGNSKRRFYRRGRRRFRPLSLSRW